MKFKLAALALLTSVALFCSESNGDLLDRMLGRGGCGGCQAVSSCCDTPAPSCGRGINLCINVGLPGRLFDHGCGGGCNLRSGRLLAGGGACDAGCGGCETIVDDGCGCGGRLRGRVSGLFGRFGGCGAPVADCGPTCPDDCGCGGGLLAGGLFSGGLFSSMGGGCGCDVAPAVSAGCGCDSAPACGCGLNLNVRDRVGGLFGRVRGGGCGCDPCGSTDACGCGLDLRGRVSGLFGRLGNIGCGCDNAPACGCGDVAAPAPSVSMGCGCDDAPACGCGLNLNLRGRVGGLFDRVGNLGCGTCGSPDPCGCGINRAPVRSLGSRIPRPFAGCGCDNAPACGCDAAPAADCGCADASSCGCGGRLRGAVSNVPRPFQNCGCGNVGCDGGCGGCGGGKLGLLDRLRGDRTPRGGDCGYNDGCQPACPNSGCGGGCDAGPVMYNPTQMQAVPMQAAPMDAPTVIVPEVDSAPVGEIEESVIEPAEDNDGANYRPAVDPSAFVIRSK